MKMKRMLLIALSGVALGIPLLITLLSVASRRSDGAPGLTDGKLADCPNRPNCVCSESADLDAAKIQPLNFSTTPEIAWNSAREVIVETGGTILADTPGYLAATFSSPLVRFIDDLELRLAESESRIHVRSASRVGHSDMGANRQRVENIRKLLTSKPF
ncbi:MAG: hypothetical protein ACI9R3_001798 [Verrucomicrobiales bacterium]|jgi:uncharacterized protein (DUF1499 family)